jgi:4-hydroxyphenylpyruvate dioxygenase
MSENYLGLDGIEFVEFATPNPDPLRKLFHELGFSLQATHRDQAIELYVQNEIRFLLNFDPNGYAATFTRAHGPSVVSMGWRVRNAADALKAGASRGSKIGTGDYQYKGARIPALSGIGGSLIYLIDLYQDPKWYGELGFEDRPSDQ